MPAGTAPRRRQSSANTAGSGRRLPADERERLIAEAAVQFFAEYGFGGGTRELAKRMGIAQPLIYRYFPSKAALIERVYQEVFVGRWDPGWEAWINDRSRPLRDRLIQFYQTYSSLILSYQWVRLFVFSGLRDLDFNNRIAGAARDRIWTRVISELRHVHGLPTIEEAPVLESEFEIVWGLHAMIYNIGMRRWIYNLPVPDDVNQLISDIVDTFLEGVPAIMVQRLTAVAALAD